MEALPNVSAADLDTLHDLRRSLPPGEAQHLDLGDPAHEAAIRLALEIGGFTPDKYPALYRSLDAPPAGDPPADTLLLVDAGATPDGKATARVWASAGGDVQILGGVLFAFDPDTGDLAACGENVAVSNGFLTCPTRAAQADAAPKDGLHLLQLSHATDPAGNSRFFALSAEAAVGDGIQANVLQPVIVNSGHKVIEISVGRMAGYQNTDCDYVYLNPTGVGNQDKPNLICPFKGNVPLSGTPNLAALTVNNLLTNIVVDDGSGGSWTIARDSQYTSDAQLVAGVQQGSPPNVVTWNYPYDGPNTYFANTTSLVYQTSSLQSEIVSYFYFMFDIPMQNDQPNQTFYVCSKDSPEVHSVNCTTIDNLLFWWHCAVEGTLVTLESGETLPIEQINNGHRVKSADGSAWAVRATRHGPHQSSDDASGTAAVYRIDTDKGHSLSASGAHLIALAGGKFSQICDLAAGDEILTLDGPASVTGLSAIAYDGICYSLAIGDDDEMANGDYPVDAAIYFAGGIGCGDHMAMRAHTLNRRNDLDAILARADESLHEDLRSAFADRRF
ncbi:hypothetical protein E5A73_09470 [Sphingomonas gei]|uniref:Hint domain-containing protein n=1 Tax=Sphingomonas gei TaxID=1395960 RepID=A0A4S1XCY2_9SPHN|nr:Hint domain-containing protein [Sphingomonas gei]TGX54324.1 hypothetical protein E5A73_09470 [Sphingomonas gei]